MTPPKSAASPSRPMISSWSSIGGISPPPVACTCLPVHVHPKPAALPSRDGRLAILKKSSATGTEDFWLRGTTLIPPPEAEALSGAVTGAAPERGRALRRLAAAAGSLACPLGLRPYYSPSPPF